MSGPAPKHPSARARRNNPKAGFATLPASGRSGKVPTWPLEADAGLVAERDRARDKVAELQVELAGAEDGRTKGRLSRQLQTAELAEVTLTARMEQAERLEAEQWASLWGTPQAVMWDESWAFARMVAQFVRWNVRAEQGDLKAAVEARLRGSELGLSPLSLQKLRQEIEKAEESEGRAQQRRQRQAPKPAAGKGDDDPRTALSVVS